jgi:hypothetical protein
VAALIRERDVGATLVGEREIRCASACREHADTVRRRSRSAWLRPSECLRHERTLERRGASIVQSAIAVS